MTGWREQWERTRRWFDRLERVYEGGPGGTEQARDDVYAFFQNAYHLKDWIKNDSALGHDPKAGPTPGGAVEGYVKENDSLSLCADIANGTKHLKLTTPKTGDPDTAIRSNDATVLPGTGKAAHAFRIHSNGTQHDALDVARDVIAKWEEFIAMAPPGGPRGRPSWAQGRVRHGQIGGG